jgi:hypothetical protein
MLTPMLKRGMAAALILAAGCSSKPNFVQIAPGVSVSPESIDDYADQHGLSHAEAKERIAAEVMSSGDAGASALGDETSTAGAGVAAGR